MTLKAFTLLTTFLLTGTSVAQQAPTGCIEWVDCASNVPQPLQGSPLPTTLPSTLHCGRLDVPMDYSRPATANNTVTLGFAMYRPESPQGLLNL